MSDQIDRFGDADIAVVTFAPLSDLVRYRDWMLAQMGQGRQPEDRHDDAGEPVAFLSDPERASYRALGVARTSYGRVYNPGTIRMYARLVRRGRRFRRPVHDTRQLGADVVLTGDGSIHSIFRPETPDSRPSIDQLVAAVDEARR